MKKVLLSILTIITIIASFIILKVGSAIIDIDLQSPIGSPLDTDISTDRPVTPIVITETVPIALDCRAVTTVKADIAVKKEYQIFGKVISTDKVIIHAVGDYDVCVDGMVSRTTTTANGSKTQKIVVPADAVVFHRPRIDTSKSTLQYDRGKISRLALSDDNVIVDISLKVAQHIIGSDDCIETAWESTQKAVEDSLRRQADDDGIHNVTIEWSGRPAYDSDSGPLPDIPDIESNVNDLVCVSK